MLASDIITETIPPLKPTDGGTKAIDWMYEFKTTHLPIVEKGKFIGLISEDDIMDFNHPDDPLSTYERQLYRPFVRETDHIYVVLRYASTIQSPLIPVLDANDEYIGLITMDSLMHYMSSVSGIQEDGGIIEIKLNGLKDYVLSDIARLVESNNAYILSMYMHNIPGSHQIRLTIKVSITDIRHILSTFERYEYEVEAFYQEENVRDMFKDRYDSLMKYLNT
ncbi:MAG: acetoin utilization protein AcuB [Limisphaerales bacterium]